MRTTYLIVVDHGTQRLRVQGLPAVGQMIVALPLHLSQHCAVSGEQ